MIKLAKLLSKPTDDFWNDNVLQNVDYARYVLGHKANVARAGIKLGLNPWTIIKHDYTKFSPKMFDVYEDYFFGPDGIRNGKENINPALQKRFRRAADWHYTQEAHHNDKVGKPENIETEMESVADWYSVNRTNAKLKNDGPVNFPTFNKWWDSRKNLFLQHNAISPEAYNKIEENVKKDYSFSGYMWNKLKGTL